MSEPGPNGGQIGEELTLPFAAQPLEIPRRDIRDLHAARYMTPTANPRGCTVLNIPIGLVALFGDRIERQSVKPVTVLVNVSGHRKRRGNHRRYWRGQMKQLR